MCVYFAKAWIGAAFSLGFIFGPLLGALCSQWGVAYSPKSTVIFFIFPAVVSLILSLINIAFVNQYCPETLPINKRVIMKRSVFSLTSFLGSQEAKQTTIKDVYTSIIPWQLFKFDRIHNVKSVNGRFLSMSVVMLFGTILFRYIDSTSIGFSQFFIHDYICWFRIYNHFSRLQSIQLEQVSHSFRSRTFSFHS